MVKRLENDCGGHTLLPVRRLAITNRKITALALAALMLLMAFPANASIHATSVEVRGAIAEPSTDPGFRTGMLASDINAAWTPYNFDGFYYDLKNDLGRESIAITPGSLPPGVRTIPLQDLTYMTSGQPRVLYAVLNGKASDASGSCDPTGSCTFNGLQQFDAGQMSSVGGAYNVVGWQGLPYVGIKNHSYKLSKLIIEQGNDTSEKKTLAVGDTWDIGGGWTLTANSIDAKATPGLAWITLRKDGIDKNVTVVSQGQVYTYVEPSIGGESNVSLFVTYIDSVFSGATGDVVQLRYTWAIDTNITVINGGEKYGLFRVLSTEPVMLQNTDNIVTLSSNATINLIGNISFRVANSGMLRFYPMVTSTDPGTYEVRGTVAEPSIDPSFKTGMLASDINASWNPSNFAGFYYDLDNGIGNESLSFAAPLNTRNISATTLIYTTNPEEVSFGYSGFGSYQVVGFMGGKYFTGYTANSTPPNPTTNVVPVSALAQGQLQKVLMDDDTKRAVSVGGTLPLKEGYVLKATDMNVTDSMLLISLLKGGSLVDTTTLHTGQTYVFTKKVGNVSTLPIIMLRLDSMFAGTGVQVAFLKGAFQISENPTSVKLGDQYNDMKVATVALNEIEMSNPSDIALTRNTTVDLLGNVKFRVADSDVIRFYPEVDYVISTTKVGVYDGIGDWALENTANMGADIVGFGFPNTIPAVGDWNGDGTTKEGIYNKGGNNFLLRNTSAPSGFDTIGLGWAGVTPVVGDWNGDGSEEVGVYDNVGTWALWNSTSGMADIMGFGWTNTIPVAGDWNGYSKTDIGIYNIVGNNFLLRNPNGTYTVVGLGWTGVTPVVGDWNGDGRTKVGVYDGSTGTWALENASASGGADIIGFGFPNTIPVVGDWNGDGKTDVGIYNKGGNNFLLRNTDGTITVIGLGWTGVTPVVGRWG